MFGIGKAFKKAWKGTFGKLEDAVEPYKTTLIGAGVGFLTGGLGGAASQFWQNGLMGAAVGAGIGYSQDSAAKAQEQQMRAQIESAEKLAKMQNNVVVSADPAPVATTQSEEIREQNEATRKAKAFRFAQSTRGNFGGYKKTTLG